MEERLDTTHYGIVRFLELDFYIAHKSSVLGLSVREPLASSKRTA